MSKAYQIKKIIVSNLDRFTPINHDITDVATNRSAYVPGKFVNYSVGISGAWIRDLTLNPKFKKAGYTPIKFAEFNFMVAPHPIYHQLKEGGVVLVNKHNAIALAKQIDKNNGWDLLNSIVQEINGRCDLKLFLLNNGYLCISLPMSYIRKHHDAMTGYFMKGLDQMLIVIHYLTQNLQDIIFERLNNQDQTQDKASA